VETRSLPVIHPPVIDELRPSARVMNEALLVISGQFHEELFRARRLVVDTGLHAKRWTRQQGIDYGIEASEVERYAASGRDLLASGRHLARAREEGRQGFTDVCLSLPDY
jgi:hypothetical protein